MLNNESQVRLTINLEGRLGAIASNSTSKDERRKAANAAKHGKTWRFKKYQAPEVQKCSQSIMLSSDCVAYYISEEGKPIRFKNRSITVNEWKKLSATARLVINLQITADYLSGHENTQYFYKVIN